MHEMVRSERGLHVQLIIDANSKSKMACFASETAR